MSTARVIYHQTMSDLRWVIINEDGQHLWLGRSTEPLHEELARAVPTLNDRGFAAWLAILLGEYWFAQTVHVIGVRLLTCRSGAWDAAVAAFQRRRDKTLAGLQQRPLELDRYNLARGQVAPE